MKQYKANGNYVHLHEIPNFRLEIPCGETIYSVQNFALTLDSISKIMKRSIPEIGMVTLTIRNQFEEGNPICYRESQLIVLHTEMDTWAQAAYQYAHELCHYAIPHHVTQNLRWIEESICETASLYFMRQLGVYWNKIGVHLFAKDNKKLNYRFLLAQYAKDREKEYEAFAFNDPDLLQYLEFHCEDRLKNMYLARHLLPIFTDHPKTWQAVPKLCCIHQDTLPKALEAWILESPEESRPGLQMIKALFD